MAEELLRAADQYMLEGLKRLCEDTLQKTLSVDTLQVAYELSENFNAAQLGRHCVMFALEAYAELSQVPLLARGRTTSARHISVRLDRMTGRRAFCAGHEGRRRHGLRSLAAAHGAKAQGVYHRPAGQEEQRHWQRLRTFPHFELNLFASTM